MSESKKEKEKDVIDKVFAFGDTVIDAGSKKAAKLVKKSQVD